MIKHIRHLVVLAACLSLAACGAYDLTEPERQTTELAARDYAERAEGRFVSCSGQDSDGDGYVTCSTQTSAGTPDDLLCAYKSRGCKRKS